MILIYLSLIVTIHAVLVWIFLSKTNIMVKFMGSFVQFLEKMSKDVEKENKKPESETPKRKKRAFIPLSEAHRKKLSEIQKRRWAKKKAQEQKVPEPVLKDIKQLESDLASN